MSHLPMWDTVLVSLHHPFGDDDDAPDIAVPQHVRCLYVHASACAQFLRLMCGGGMLRHDKLECLCLDLVRVDGPGQDAFHYCPPSVTSLSLSLPQLHVSNVDAWVDVERVLLGVSRLTQLRCLSIGPHLPDALSWMPTVLAGLTRLVLFCNLALPRDALPSWHDHRIRPVTMPPYWLGTLSTLQNLLYLRIDNYVHRPHWPPFFSAFPGLRTLIIGSLLQGEAAASCVADIGNCCGLQDLRVAVVDPSARWVLPSCSMLVVPCGTVWDLVVAGLLLTINYD
jgi:hypothetical protein